MFSVNVNLWCQYILNLHFLYYLIIYAEAKFKVEIFSHITGLNHFEYAVTNL